MAFYVERRGLRAVPVIAASLALGVAFALIIVPTIISA